MKTWIRTIVITLALTIGHLTTCTAHEGQLASGIPSQDHSAVVSYSNSTKYHLYEDRLEPAGRQEALITDTTQALRLCNSRQQRIRPTTGTTPKNILGRNTYSNRFCSLRFLAAKCYLKTTTTPIPSNNPCDYYVIALRRIIR